MRLAFISILFLNFAFAKKFDLSHLKIESNPKEEKEWRASTVEKIFGFCMQMGGNQKICECIVKVQQENYRENELLKIRNKMIEMLENQQDTSKDSDIIKLSKLTEFCQKND